MSSKHTITAIRSGCVNGMDWESEYEITFSVATKGSPDYWNKAGGHWEQGWDPEIEFVSIKPGAGAHGAFSDLAQKSLEDWASDWLQTDGFSDAMEIVAADMEDARDEARERAAEDRGGR